MHAGRAGGETLPRFGQSPHCHRSAGLPIGPGWTHEGFFRRIKAATKGIAAEFRCHQPAIIGKPPSAGQVPADSTKHAADFAGRHAEP